MRRKAGITATFGGAVTASTVTTTGTGTVQFNGTVTAATAVNFGADGTISMGADALIAGAVTNTTAGQGTLTFAAPTANRTLVSGATGSTGTGLKAVNIATGNGFTSTMTGAVKAGTVTVTGTGTATFTGGVTGNINIGSAATVTAAAAITGNVDNTTTTGTGTLTLGATIGVTGNIGATNALNTVTSNSTGGTTAFGGTVRATTITLGGTGTATFADTVTGAVNFTADGTATVAAGKNIVGAVTNTTANNGTLTFAGGTTTGGAIGSTGTGLLAANFNGGTVSIGHDIKAATTTFANASTSTFTSARTLTGNVVVSGTATVDTGAFNTAVTGTMSTGATTTLKTALTSATVAGQFNVGGNATVVAGTKVYVNVGAFAVADGAKIKVVNGTGGVNVVNLTTGNVTTNSAVLSFSGQAGNDTGTLAATGEDLYVVATRAAGGFTAVSGIASTAPGGAAGAVLNAIAVAVPTVGSDMATVVNTFNGYTAAQLQTELPKLAPLTGAAAVSAGMGSVSQALNLVNTRMASSRGDSSILSADVAGSGVSAGTTAGREFWLKGFGNNSAQGAVDGFSGYGGTTYGVAAGVDTGIGGDMRVGVSLGYAKARIGNNNDGNAGAGGRVNVDTYQISLYGSREFGRGYIDGMVGYAWHRTDNSRLAALGRTATGATNADQWTARIGGGYRIAMGGKTVFTPLASLEFSNFRQKAYTESGAGALSLNVDGVSASRIKGGVGARISGEGTMASGTVYRPEVHVGVYNDFRNAGVDSSASFTGGGTSFVTTGARLQRTSFNVGAGVTFLQGKTGSVGLVYDYEGRSSYKAHNVSLQGRWSF